MDVDSHVFIISYISFNSYRNINNIFLIQILYRTFIGFFLQPFYLLEVLTHNLLLHRKEYISGVIPFGG